MPENASITFVVSSEKFLVTVAAPGLESRTCDLANTELAPPMARALSMLMIGLNMDMAPEVETTEPF